MALKFQGGKAVAVGSTIAIRDVVAGMTVVLPAFDNRAKSGNPRDWSPGGEATIAAIRINGSTAQLTFVNGATSERPSNTTVRVSHVPGSGITTLNESRFASALLSDKYFSDVLAAANGDARIEQAVQEYKAATQKFRQAISRR